MINPRVVAFKIRNNKQLSPEEIASIETMYGISADDEADEDYDLDDLDDAVSTPATVAEMPTPGRTSDGGIGSKLASAQRDYIDEIASLNENILNLTKTKNGISILVKPEFPPHLVIKKLNSEEIVKKWYLISHYMKKPEVIRTFDLLNCVKPELHDNLVMHYNRLHPKDTFEVYELPSQPLKVQVTALFSAVSDIHRDNDICDAIRRLDMYHTHRATDRSVVFTWSPDQAEVDLKEFYSKVQILVEIGKVRLGPNWIHELGISNLVSAVYFSFTREKSPLTDEFSYPVFKKDRYQKISKLNTDPIKSFFDDVFTFIEYLQNNRSRTRAFTSFEKKITLAPKSGSNNRTNNYHYKDSPKDHVKDDSSVDKASSKAPPVAAIPPTATPVVARKVRPKSDYLCFEIAKGKICNVSNCPYNHTVTEELKTAALKYLDKKKSKK